MKTQACNDRMEVMEFLNSVVRLLAGSTYSSPHDIKGYQQYSTCYLWFFINEKSPQSMVQNTHECPVIHGLGLSPVVKIARLQRV